MNQMQCAACGQNVPVGARFCPNCGASQAATEEERRLVTVVFADIVGFTTRSESMDPEEVKHLVDRTFDRLALDITSFGGKVDKVVGDQIIALFGAPVAHEDDAERAVRAALRMQQSVVTSTADFGQTVQMRIGVNTGEVLVGSTSAGGDYTAMGDTMNLAARLEELAGPSQVVVGPATYAVTVDAISYRPIGEIETRGRSNKVQAYQAVSPIRPPGARTRRGTRFIGRDPELSLLMAQGRLAADHHRAQVGLVSGEAGIGKTRVVEEAAGQMASRFGARVLEGRCVAYGEANVWWPIAEMVRHGLDLTGDLSLDEVRPILVRGALIALGLHPAEIMLPEGLGTEMPEVDRLVTTLAHVLGYDTSMRGGDRDHNRSEVMFAISTMLAGELKSRPVVMVISDMDYASEAVWALVNNILSDLADTPLLLLLTARTADFNRHLAAGRHGALNLHLGPLEEEAAADVLAQMGLDLPDDAARELVSRSGGNPFFLEELANLVSSRTTIDGPDVVAELMSGRLDQLPDTLRGTIAARLDSLSQSQRALLQDASVLGRIGSIKGLAVLAQESRGIPDISDDLEALVDAEVLHVDPRQYQFRSDLVRDVAYGTITKTLRAQRHYGIAEYLAQMQETGTNPQLGGSRNSGPIPERGRTGQRAGLGPRVWIKAELNSKALSWLAEAGQRALNSDPPSAEAWFTSGLDLAADDATRSEFLYGRAKARCEVRDIVGSRADLDALDLLTSHDPLIHGRALLVRGDVERKAGNLDRAAALLREASDRLASLSAFADQALALRLLGLTEMYRSDEELSRRALDASRRVAAEAGDQRSQAWALQSMAWLAFNTGRVSEARELIGMAVETFTALNDLGGLAWAQGVQAWVAFHSGRFDASRELVDAVLPETARRGDPWAESIMRLLDASLLLWTGRAREAVDTARVAHSKADGAGELNLAVQAAAIEGRALVSLGRISDGSARLEEAFAMADRADEPEGRRMAAVANCSSAARLGDSDRAIRWAARFDGVRNMHVDSDVVGQSDLVISLALAMLQRGAVEEASTELGWVDSPDPDASQLYGHAVGALIDAARGDSTNAHVRVDTVLKGDATYLDRVMALLARAATYARNGDTDGSDQALLDAREELAATDDKVTSLFVDQLGGVCGFGDLFEAEARLRAAGIDPTGWRTAWVLATGKTLTASSEA